MEKDKTWWTNLTEAIFGRRITPAERLAAQVQVLRGIERNLVREAKHSEKELAQCEGLADNLLYNEQQKGRGIERVQRQVYDLFVQAENHRKRAQVYRRKAQDVMDTTTKFKVLSADVEMQQASVKAAAAIVNFTRYMPAFLIQRIVQELEARDKQDSAISTLKDAIEMSTETALGDDDMFDPEVAKKRAAEQINELRAAEGLKADLELEGLPNVLSPHKAKAAAMLQEEEDKASANISSSDKKKQD